MKASCLTLHMQTKPRKFTETKSTPPAFQKTAGLSKDSQPADINLA
jgi:hypothetical protein